jgi:uncharacterized protein (TIGR04255 family)
MNTNAEKWPKAPLIFVLTAVKFSQYPNLDKHIDNLHEATLADLPERINAEGLTFQVDLGSPGQEPRIEKKRITRLISPENGLSMFMRDDLLAIEMTQYDGHKRAMAIIEKLLEAVLTTLPNLRPQLLAMRYIDAVLSGDEEKVENSVQSGFLGLQRPKNNAAKHAMTNFSQQFSVDDRTLTVGMHRGTKIPGNVVLPDGLEIPAQLKADVKLAQFREHNGDFCLLDFDCSSPYQGPADLKTLMQTLANIHHELSDVLPQVATAAAMRRWKGLAGGQPA